MLSSKAEAREKQSKESEIKINKLRSKIVEFKGNLLSNISVTYKPMEKKIQDSFGKLVIKVKKSNFKTNSFYFDNLINYFIIFIGHKK